MDWIGVPLEKSQKEELEKYYVTRYEFEKNNNRIFKEIDQKTNENKDRIEKVDDKHTEKWYETQRTLDRNTQSMNNLNDSMGNLNINVEKMSASLMDNIQATREINGRVEKTEVNLSDKELIKQQRKVETVKLLTVIVTGLLGAGGLFSWLGPLLFGK